MAFMQWTPEMSVGVPELDDDHKVLIRIINQLARNVGEKAEEEVVRSSLFGLMRYAQFHFAREEKVMAASDYTEIGDHKGEHGGFVEKIRAITEALDEAEDGVPEEINETLLEFLKEWLNHHILIVDMSYRPFVEGDARIRKVAQDFDAAEVWWSA